jgi:hypothetical protein
MGNRMGDKIAVNQKVLDIAKAVREHVNANGRGCPKGHLQYVLGFRTQDINLAVDCNLIEAGRGKEGGYFPAGEKPVPQTDSGSDSLKARMAEFLNGFANGDTMDADFARSLHDEYLSQNEARKAAIAKAKAEKEANA